MSTELVAAEDDRFDEVFYTKHGVGDEPEELELAAVAHLMDKTKASAKEVAFCRYIIKGDTTPTAYKKAFEYDGTEMDPKSFSRAAMRLLRRPRVAAKLHEIQERLMAIEEEDLSNLIHELNEDRQLARALGQPTAAIAAVKAKANLLGLDQATSVTNNITVNLTDSQKKQLLGRVNKQLKYVEDAIDADYEEVKDE